MNLQGAGLLDDVALAQITQDVADMLQDSDTRTAVTIEAAGGQTVNAASGIVTTASSQIATTGWLSTLSLREVEAHPNTYQMGDVVLLVPVASVTTAPTVGNVFWVTSNSIRHNVLTVEKDALALHYVLVGRRTE